MPLLGSAASLSVPPAPPSQVACAADAAMGRPGEDPVEPHCHLLSDGTLVCHSAAAAVDGGVVCGSIGGIGGRPGLTTYGHCNLNTNLVLELVPLCAGCHSKSTLYPILATNLEITDRCKSNPYPFQGLSKFLDLFISWFRLRSGKDVQLPDVLVGRSLLGEVAAAVRQVRGGYG